MISLEEHFSFIREKGPVLVAVSGGSDSMALLHLANSWAKKQNREIHAVSVDHGLRPEAAAEAAFVAMVCDGLGIVHTTLSWDGVKPVAGISEAARNARYELIGEFARDIGIRIILVGHTFDDQAETLMMRLARAKGSRPGSGRGQSGMCKRTMIGADVLLMRPLLNVSRQQLRDYLTGISQSWVEDPSNHDESYERVRVRTKLENNDRLKTNLVDYARIMGRMRNAVANDACALLRESCICLPGHLFQLDVVKLTQVPIAVSGMAIKTVIAAAGGGSFLICDQKLEMIVKLMMGGGSGRITAGNCIVEINIEYLSIYREVRNLVSDLVEPGESVIWDGRVYVTNDSDEAVRIEPMSSLYLEALMDDESLGLQFVRRAVVMSSPVITTASGIVQPIFFSRSKLPMQVDIRCGAQAIENFCPQWEFCLLDWLKTIDIASGQNPQKYLFDQRDK